MPSWQKRASCVSALWFCSARRPPGCSALVPSPVSPRRGPGGAPVYVAQRCVRRVRHGDVLPRGVVARSLRPFQFRFQFQLAVAAPGERQRGVPRGNDEFVSRRGYRGDSSGTRQGCAVGCHGRRSGSCFRQHAPAICSSQHRRLVNIHPLPFRPGLHRVALFEIARRALWSGGRPRRTLPGCFHLIAADRRRSLCVQRAVGLSRSCSIHARRGMVESARGNHRAHVRGSRAGRR